MSAAVWDVLFLVTSVVLGEEGSLMAQANTAFQDSMLSVISERHSTGI